MAEDLKPCPFCGKRPSVGYVRDGYKVVCTFCGGSGPAAFHGPAGKPSSKDRAIAAWNRRATGDDLRAVLKLAGDFIEDEADNRAAAGSVMSDYEREPRELLARIDAALAS